MKQAEYEQFIMQLPRVQREHQHGNVLFFVGDDHLVPFVSIATKDQDFDNVSQLNRPGAFRINIGISKATYAALIGDAAGNPVDYTQVNTFLPHPHYAPYNFICITQPAGDKTARTMELIAEAHAIASEKNVRAQRVKSELNRGI